MGTGIPGCGTCLLQAGTGPGPTVVTENEGEPGRQNEGEPDGI